MLPRRVPAGTTFSSGGTGRFESEIDDDYAALGAFVARVSLEINVYCRDGTRRRTRKRELEYGPLTERSISLFSLSDLVDDERVKHVICRPSALYQRRGSTQDSLQRKTIVIFYDVGSAETFHVDGCL